MIASIASLAGILALLGIAFLLLRRGAHRFAERRRAEGAWDADGPLQPTEPPKGWLAPRGPHGPPPEDVFRPTLRRRRRP